DVVHIHHWVRLTSNLGTIAVAKGIPVVVTLHDLYATCPRFFRMKEDGSCCVLPLSPENCLHSADRWLFQHDMEIRGALASFRDDVLAELAASTRIIAPSATHAATVSERLGVKDIAIQVLPHGCMTPLRPAPRPDPGKKLQVVYFSHLYPFKGAKHLIEAFLKMEHRNEVALHLFGGAVLPDFAAELKALAKGEDITFHGPYTPKDLETFPMDLVVLPTLLSESYSFILDEAVGLGVPIMASDAGAIPERCGKSAFVFRRGNVEQMTQILDMIAADRSFLDKKRAAEPIKIMSQDEHLTRLETIYSEVIQEGPAKTIEDRRFSHLKDQWERREYGFKELIRSEQWEYLVASLRKRIVELEVQLATRTPPGGE
ncbi:MAG: glycosyltransferase, partial [Planctomycetota bacterium]